MKYIFLSRHWLYTTLLSLGAVAISCQAALPSKEQTAAILRRNPRIVQAMQEALDLQVRHLSYLNGLVWAFGPKEEPEMQALLARVPSHQQLSKQTISSYKALCTLLEAYAGEEVEDPLRQLGHLARIQRRIWEALAKHEGQDVLVALVGEAARYLPENEKLHPYLRSLIALAQEEPISPGLPEGRGPAS